MLRRSRTCDTPAPQLGQILIDGAFYSDACSRTPRSEASARAADIYGLAADLSGFPCVVLVAALVRLADTVRVSVLVGCVCSQRPWPS